VGGGAEDASTKYGGEQHIDEILVQYIVGCLQKIVDYKNIKFSSALAPPPQKTTPPPPPLGKIRAYATGLQLVFPGKM